MKPIDLSSIAHKPASVQAAVERALRAAETYQGDPVADMEQLLGELRAEAERRGLLMDEPPDSPVTLEEAARLGFFALGVPCCAGADGLRIRVVALEPVTPLDLSVARMKLERWEPGAAQVIELAAAGCWA